MLFTCRKCNTRVEGETIFVFGFHYHPNCFVCFDCGKNLSDVYFEINKLPYCELDYKKPRPGDPTTQPVFKKKPNVKPAAHNKEPRIFKGIFPSNNTNNTNNNNKSIINNGENNIKKSTSDSSINSSSDKIEFNKNIPKSGSSNSISSLNNETPSNNASLHSSNNEISKNANLLESVITPEKEVVHIHHHHHHHDNNANKGSLSTSNTTSTQPSKSISTTIELAPQKVEYSNSHPSSDIPKVVCQQPLSNASSNNEKPRSNSFDNSLDDILNSMNIMVSKPKNNNEPKNINQISNPNANIGNNNENKYNNNDNNNNDNNNPYQSSVQQQHHHHHHHYHSTKPSLASYPSNSNMTLSPNNNNNNTTNAEPPVVIGDHRSCSPRNEIPSNANINQNNSTHKDQGHKEHEHDSSDSDSNSDSDFSVHDSSSSDDDSDHESKRRKKKELKKQNKNKNKDTQDNQDNQYNEGINSLNTSNNSNSTKKPIQLDVDFTFGKKDNQEKCKDGASEDHHDHSHEKGLNIHVDLHFGKNKDITSDQPHVDSCQKNIEQLISNEPVIVNRVEIHNDNPKIENNQYNDKYHGHQHHHSDPVQSHVIEKKVETHQHIEKHHGHQHHHSSPTQVHADKHHGPHHSTPNQLQIDPHHQQAHQHHHSSPVQNKMEQDLHHPHHSHGHHHHHSAPEQHAHVTEHQSIDNGGGLRQYSKTYVTNDPDYHNKPNHHHPNQNHHHHHQHTETTAHIGGPKDKVTTRTITTIQSSGMKCKTCKLEIFGTTLLNHLNDSYHPACFSCTLCKDVIIHPYFTDPKTNDIYCAKCQIILNDRDKKSRDSLGFCNSCFKFLSESDNVIIIDKEKYHNNCFKCNVCKDLIRGPNFSREVMTSTSSNYCCNSCLYSGRVDKCPFCSGVVLGNSMFVPNFGNCHPKCFKCSNCQIVIKHSIPFTIGNNNKPTCQQCSSSVGGASK